MVMYETWVIFLMVYLLLLLMILTGFLLKLFPPKYDGTIWGYRSEKALLSKASWNFAQEAFSKKSILVGVILLCLLAFFNMLFPLYQPVVNIVSVTISVIAWIVVYLLVERDLKKHFPQK